MKKTIQISIFFCLSMHGLNYSIENKTDGQIHIILEYEANSMCPPAERIIGNHQKIIIKSGLCHAYHITIHGIDQSFTIKKQITKTSLDQCIISILHNDTSSKSSIDQSNNIILMID